MLTQIKKHFCCQDDTIHEKKTFIAHYENYSYENCSYIGEIKNQ